MDGWFKCISMHQKGALHYSCTNSEDWWLVKRNGRGTDCWCWIVGAEFSIFDHKLLLNKLSCYGFEWSILSYLTDRKYTVHFNSHYSAVRSVNCGVPEGSCFGPLLLFIFMNDLPLILNCATTAMYADDSTAYNHDKSVLQKLIDDQNPRNNS